MDFPPFTLDTSLFEEATVTPFLHNGHHRLWATAHQHLTACRTGFLDWGFGDSLSF
jgi:hypothetical protein